LDNWDKLLIIGIVVSSLIIAYRYLLPSTTEQLVGNTFDYRNLIVSSLNLKLTWLQNEPLIGRNFTIIDKNYKILYEGITDRDYVHIDLKKICDADGYYYVNVTMVAHFVEGGTETRYMYYFFNFQRDSINILNITGNFKPENWERIPVI
jgi:hypothetical protein